MSVDLLSEFSANIQAQQLLKPSDRVLVAVSSGPDSWPYCIYCRMASVELGIFISTTRVLRQMRKRNMWRH